MSQSYIANAESILEFAQGEARRSFDFERADICTQLPPSYKRAFGKVAFHKKQPVLVVSPFDVPPGPIRAEWMSRFLECRKQLKKLPYLVYYYGESALRKAYRLVDGGSLMLFEEGAVRGYDQPSVRIKRKLLDDNLSAADKKVLRALAEMEKDLRRKQEDRHGGFNGQFLEGHNLLTCKVQIHNPLGLHLGTRVQVYQKDDDVLVKGTIDEQRGEFYHVMYDNGTEEWLPLADVRFSKIDPNDETESFQTPVKQVLDEGAEDVQQSCGLQPKRKASPRASITEASAKKAKGLSDYMKRIYKNRVGEDGCLIPSTVKRLPDGTYATPRGRQPLGMRFDKYRGVYVMADDDEDFKDVEESGSSSAGIEDE